VIVAESALRAIYLIGYFIGFIYRRESVCGTFQGEAWSIPCPALLESRLSSCLQYLSGGLFSPQLFG